MTFFSIPNVISAAQEFRGAAAIWCAFHLIQRRQFQAWQTKPAVALHVPRRPHKRDQARSPRRAAGFHQWRDETFGLAKPAIALRLRSGSLGR
jgi:hypothetical protein